MKDKYIGVCLTPSIDLQGDKFSIRRCHEVDKVPVILENNGNRILGNAKVRKLNNKLVAEIDLFDFKKVTKEYSEEEQSRRLVEVIKSLIKDKLIYATINGRLTKSEGSKPRKILDYDITMINLSFYPVHKDLSPVELMTKTI